MAGGAPAPAQLVVAGANHRSSTVAFRDRLFVEDAALPAVLQRLREAGLGQALVLSTCDRVELLAAAVEPEQARTRFAHVLAERAGVDAEALKAQLYLYAGEAALRHLFAVAASLDSAIVGEPQVLGQLKAAHKSARDAGMVGREVEAALQAAYAAAKRVRSETRIAEGAVSIVAAAVALAREVHGDLASLAGLLIGTGDMGQLMAEALLAAGLGRISVASPQAARAEALARQLAGHHADFATLAAALSEADIVIACAGTGRYLLSGEMMEEALRRRRRRPVYVIDLGVPSDVEPAVNRVDDAYLYDLADLERSTLRGQAERSAAAEEAWRVLEEELARFLRAHAEREAVPTVVALRRHVEKLREEVLAEVGEKDAAAATRLLVNRMLHGPSEVLRTFAAAEGASPRRALAERLIRLIFRLPPDGGAGDGSGEEEKQ